MGLEIVGFFAWCWKKEKKTKRVRQKIFIKKIKRRRR